MAILGLPRPQRQRFVTGAQIPCRSPRLEAVRCSSTSDLEYSSSAFAVGAAPPFPAALVSPRLASLDVPQGGFVSRVLKLLPLAGIMFAACQDSSAPTAPAPTPFVSASLVGGPENYIVVLHKSE